jgi:hypothetical protein
MIGFDTVISLCFTFNTILDRALFFDRNENSGGARGNERSHLAHAYILESFIHSPATVH